MEIDTIIKLKNINKNYAEHTVLKNINLEIRQGESISVIGKSGCGKTSLLRCLNLLEIPNSGTMVIDGIKVDALYFRNSCQQSKPKKAFEDVISHNQEFRDLAFEIRKRVGFLSQSLDLFPHKTILDNISLSPIIIRNMPKEAASELSISLLNKVGMSNFTDRYPHQLSGGQKQRVAIARSLAMNPKVMLYDEPTSALDPSLISEIAELMLELKSEGMTQVVVTHSMYLAKAISDRILHLDAGSIVADSHPDLYFSSSDNIIVDDSLQIIYE